MRSSELEVKGSVSHYRSPEPPRPREVQKCSTDLPFSFPGFPLFFGMASNAHASSSDYRVKRNRHKQASDRQSRVLSPILSGSCQLISCSRAFELSRTVTVLALDLQHPK